MNDKQVKAKRAYW